VFTVIVKTSLFVMDTRKSLPKILGRTVKFILPTFSETESVSVAVVRPVLVTERVNDFVLVNEASWVSIL